MKIGIRCRKVFPRRLLGPALGLWALSASALAPPGRYAFPGDGTVHDNETGLVWQQTVAPGTYTWSAALSYCTSLDLAGTGWRLPSVKELVTLVDVSVSNPSIDTTAFPSTLGVSFWTSSPLAGNSSYAWNVSFDAGGASYGGGVGVTYDVRCVR